MSTGWTGLYDSDVVFTITPGANVITVPNPSSSTMTFGPSVPSSSKSINAVIGDLEKEIGYLHSKIAVLEDIVREEVAGKYEAYKRIAELTKNS